MSSREKKGTHLWLMSTCCVSGLSWIYCLEKKFNCPDRAMAVKEARVVVYGWEFNMYICHEPLLSNLNLTYDRNLSEIHWMSFTITQYRNESRLRRIIIIKDMGPLTYFLILFKEREHQKWTSGMHTQSSFASSSLWFLSCSVCSCYIS